MGVKELLEKIRKEKKEIEDEIKYLEREIERKESKAEFIVNTQWERLQLERLREKLT
ncbi:MAG TPA: hypothetical protein VMZ91_14675 [Candidatus Paceibacterota bacterium]|nr:hypothetical protein [Candidatus Paceibacterota bacterium]